MGDVLLNGRLAADFELAAIGRARQRERDQALDLLAGLLPGPGQDLPERAARPVTDLILEFGG